MINQLLSSLSDRDRQDLDPFMVEVELKQNATLFEADRPVDGLYFMEDGLASIVTPKAHVVEVGIVGREGFLGWPLILGTGSSPFRTFMQVGGTARYIKASHVADAIATVSALKPLLLRYIGVYLVQTAQTAACNGMHPVRQRLARWLLMSHDRLNVRSMPLTHEFLAYMLSVRRPSVSEAMKALEKLGAVHQGHGRVAILDRDKLMSAACGCYTIVMGEYVRALGPVLAGGTEQAEAESVI